MGQKSCEWMLCLMKKCFTYQFVAFRWINFQVIKLFLISNVTNIFFFKQFCYKFIVTLAFFLFPFRQDCWCSGCKTTKLWSHIIWIRQGRAAVMSTFSQGSWYLYATRNYHPCQTITTTGVDSEKYDPWLAGSWLYFCFSP